MHPENNNPAAIVPSRPDNSSTQLWAESFALQQHNYTWEQVLRVLRKHLRLALAVGLLLAAIGALLVFSQKSFYRSTARLEVAPPGSGINTLHEIESAPEPENQDYLETQVQVLSSDALAMSVIRELHLDRNPEFVTAHELRESAAEQRYSVQSTGKRFPILQEQFDLATLTLAESAALERFRKKLSVSSVRNTRLLEVSFNSEDAQLAQTVTNTLVANFIDQNYRDRYNSTMQASDWLSVQLNDLRKKVEQSNQAVADYQKKYGLVEADDHDVPMSQLMSEVNRQLSEAQANRIENEAYVHMVDDGHADAVPTLRDDKLYQDLMTRYMDLRTQLAQAKAVYGDANLNVKKLDDQLAEVSLQIDAERKRAVARIRSTYVSAKQREDLMLDEREKLRAGMAAVSSQLATYHMLKTEANANSELYNTLEGRLREAGIYAGLRSNNIRVVDLAARLRKPSGPHRLLLFSFTAFGSSIFAIALCFVRESFHNTVRTPDDLKCWTGLPSLALLPTFDQKKLSVFPSVSSTFQDKSAATIGEVPILASTTAASEALRNLRTALLFGRRQNTPRVILISSGMEGEGKTTVAVNFAIALAQLGRTCLIEGDLRQPAIGRALQTAGTVGLVEVLRGAASVEQAVVPVPNIENLSLLPCGTPSQSPADILSSARLLPLLNTLRQSYAFLVIDSPPVIPFSDARSLSSLADEVVLVGRYGMTTRRCVQRTMELLDEVNASIAGVVLNGIDLASPDYHYFTYGYRKSKTRVNVRERVDGPQFPNRQDTNKPGAMSASA